MRVLAPPASCIEPAFFALELRTLLLLLGNWVACHCLFYGLAAAGGSAVGSLISCATCALFALLLFEAGGSSRWRTHGPAAPWLALLPGAAIIPTYGLFGFSWVWLLLSLAGVVLWGLMARGMVCLRIPALALWMRRAAVATIGAAALLTMAGAILVIRGGQQRPGQLLVFSGGAGDAPGGAVTVRRIGKSGDASCGVALWRSAAHLEDRDSALIWAHGPALCHPLRLRSLPSHASFILEDAQGPVARFDHASLRPQPIELDPLPDNLLGVGIAIRQAPWEGILNTHDLVPDEHRVSFWFGPLSDLLLFHPGLVLFGSGLGLLLSVCALLRREPWEHIVRRRAEWCLATYHGADRITLADGSPLQAPTGALSEPGPVVLLLERLACSPSNRDAGDPGVDLVIPLAADVLEQRLQQVVAGRPALALLLGAMAAGWALAVLSVLLAP